MAEPAPAAAWARPLPAWPEKLRHYLRAKNNADDHLRDSGLAYTIVRPGRLTEEPGSGRVRIAERLDKFGEIPREDVAAVLLATLEADNTIHRGFDLIAGDQPLADAIAAL